MTHRSPLHPQSGVMLLEALIAILIFSVGILSIVALFANATKLTGDAKYRSDAALLSNELIGQMWVGDRDPAAINTNFAGTGGAGGASYAAWLADVQTALPGVDANPPNVAVLTVISDLPAPDNVAHAQVTVTIFWKAPSEDSAAEAHRYIATAQISR